MSPITLHKYLYANADPVRNIDPSGNFSVNEASVGLLVQLNLRTTLTVARAQPFRMSLARTLLASITAVAGTQFSAGNAAKLALQECMRSSKAGENECDPDQNIFIIGNDYPEVREHVSDAIGEGKPGMVTRKDPAHSRSWLSAHKGLGKRCNGGPGTDCDEYPFASNAEGGRDGNVSLRSVGASQNRGAGTNIRWFHEKCNVKSGEKYMVLPVQGVPTTGYVCKR